MTTLFQFSRVPRPFSIKYAALVYNSIDFSRRARHYAVTSGSRSLTINKPKSNLKTGDKLLNKMSGTNYIFVQQYSKIQHQGQVNYKLLLGVLGKSHSFYTDNKFLQTSSSKMGLEWYKSQMEATFNTKALPKFEIMEGKWGLRNNKEHMHRHLQSFLIMILFIFGIPLMVSKQSKKKLELQKPRNAVHEAGRAVMAYSSKYMDVDYVTAAPEKSNLTPLPKWVTMCFYRRGEMHPTRIEQTTTLTVDWMKDYIDMCHGGEVAEEIVFGSESLESEDKENHDGLENTPGNGTIEMILRLFSSKLQTEWRTEQKKESRRRTKEFLIQHREELDMLTEALLSQKTLQNKDVTNLFEGTTLVNKGAGKSYDE